MRFFLFSQQASKEQLWPVGMPDDWDGAYDRVIHPQNKTPDMRDRSNFVMNARPDPNIDRNISWEDATQRHTTIYQWELVDINWNTV